MEQFQKSWNVPSLRRRGSNVVSCVSAFKTFPFFLGMLDYMMWPWMERLPCIPLRYPNMVLPSCSLDTWVKVRNSIFKIILKKKGMRIGLSIVSGERLFFHMNERNGWFQKRRNIPRPSWEPIVGYKQNFPNNISKKFGTVNPRYMNT